MRLTTKEEQFRNHTLPARAVVDMLVQQCGAAAVLKALSDHFLEHSKKLGTSCAAGFYLIDSTELRIIADRFAGQQK